MNAMKTLTLLALAALAACSSPEPQGLRLAGEGTGAQVMFDLTERPLPNIPLPNDFATRFDPSSPTKRRLNASLQAATEWEKATRATLDNLDGWGTYGPITLSFDKPLDVEVIYRRHQGDDYRFTDDAVLLIDVTRDSPDFCQAMPLDMGEGNFPLTLERRDYYPNDPHNGDDNLVFEEHEEDLNGNGALDPGEDLDMDGVLDHPNSRHRDPKRFETMVFYERETNTLIMRPVMPLRENTTYAAVLTRRLLDEDGRPVRSPFKYVNHTSQTQALKPLEDCLGPYSLKLDDIAFTWAFTTQSTTRDFRVIRDGLYGLGPLSRLAEEYPARFTKIHKLRDSSGNAVTLQILPGEQFLAAAAEVMPALMGGGTDNPRVKAILDASKFIDFHVVASFESPQFFPRTDRDLDPSLAKDKYKDKDRAGKPLPLYEQVWRLDPVTGEAFTRSETVTAWITVPKYRNGPAPVAVLGHGYTGNKLDPVVYGGFFARQGIASIGVECVSHGIGLSDVELEIARGMFASKGLEPMYRALMVARAFDQNGDGIADSGADFWTSYMPHTRDVVKQSTIDYMRLVEILKSFDGQAKWDEDLRMPKDTLAGDFDGDGKVDVGGSAPISFTGGSLGGIMSGMVGGLEPHVGLVVPVAGAGGLGDVGIRSIQGGVAEAVNLRMMGPLLVTMRNTAGSLDVWQYVPDLNDLGKVKLGPLNGEPKEGDTAIARNLRSGEFRCSRVQTGGLVRAAVSSDQGDGLRFEFYSGPLPTQEREGCHVPEGTEPYLTFDTLGIEAKFQGLTHPAGEALTALGDGFGLRRQTPEMRRMMGIAQTILDSGDPINFAPFFESRSLRYGTGEQVRTRAVVINTIGDMNVPVATGAALSRAAGFIELYKKDARYGKTPNRVLIDTGVIESVERTGRYLNSQGKPVHMDVEHFSSIVPVDDGFDVPRLNPPLRLVKPSTRVGGYTGTLFPMIVPTGRHGFDTPNSADPFDVGSLMVNMLSRYLVSNGRELVIEKCLVDSSCEWIPPVPP